jgi:hypothetical protein
MANERTGARIKRNPSTRHQGPAWSCCEPGADCLELELELGAASDWRLLTPTQWRFNCCY